MLKNPMKFLAKQIEKPEKNCKKNKHFVIISPFSLTKLQFQIPTFSRMFENKRSRMEMALHRQKDVEVRTLTDTGTSSHVDLIKSLQERWTNDASRANDQVRSSHW